MEKITYAVALDVAIKAVGVGEVADKLTALKTQLAKKSKGERKPTATQKENVGFKEAIVNGLEEFPLNELEVLVDALFEKLILTELKLTGNIFLTLQFGELANEVFLLFIDAVDKGENAVVLLTCG